MNVKEIQLSISKAETKVEMLRKERNKLIIDRYKELYNIETWHKIKAEYVYSTIAKESGLSPSLIKKVILINK